MFRSTKERHMCMSLFLQLCCACLVLLTWMYFEMGGKWPYNHYLIPLKSILELVMNSLMYPSAMGYIVLLQFFYMHQIDLKVMYAIKQRTSVSKFSQYLVWASVLQPRRPRVKYENYISAESESLGALGNKEYSFIAIICRFTLARNDSTWCIQ